MRLILLGDVMLGRLVNDVLQSLPPDYAWGDTLPILRGADAVILNLECVIADRGHAQPDKAFTFRAAARHVAVLTAARAAAVSLANNHSLDYGAEALVECLQTLRGAGIAVAGAGRSQAEARAPGRVSIAGRQAALIAFTDNEPAWEAGPASPGVFHVTPGVDDERWRSLLAQVEQAATAGALVVVSAHWGTNWGRHPLREHVEAARRLIDAGAGAVFGHSPHITRAVELHRGRPVLYGCGDFVNDYAVDGVERNDWSFIWALDYAGADLQRVLLIPTVIRRFQARLAREAERAAILARMRDLCAALGTAAREIPDGLEIAGS